MQNLKLLRQDVFSKGYNDKIRADQLPKGYAADALNCFCDEEKIVERNGYTIIANTPAGSNAVTGLANFEQSSGSKFLLMNASTQIYKWTGAGSWAVAGGTDTTTSGLDMEWEIASNNVYGFNGTDTVKKFNGTTTSTVAAIPVGKYAKWFHNYLFVAGVSGNLSRLYFSNISVPETFSASDYIDVNPDDGEPITGINVLKDELIVFKRSRIWSITGFSSASFTVSNLNERMTGFGTLSHRSIVNTGDDLLFLSYIGDVPHIRSLQRTRYGTLVSGGIISDAITNTMKNLSTAQMSKTAAIFDGRKAWFAVPNGSSTNNDLVLVYDTINKAFTRHTGINASVFARSMVSGSPIIYFGESSSTTGTKVYKLDSSTSDNGNAINFRWDGPIWQVEPERKTKFKYLWTEADVVGDVDVGVYTSVDGYDFDSQGTLNLLGSSSTFPFDFDIRFGSPGQVRKRFEISYQPRNTMQVRFAKNDTSTRAKIRAYSLFYQQKGFRDA